MGYTLLLLGFLLGMRHATEADHLAAMATIASRSDTLRGAALQGAAWGVGHTITLLIFGGVALIIGGAIPDAYAHGLEALVGLMLIGLGIDLLRQMRRRRIHFHRHAHEDGVHHFHAHAHRAGEPHDPTAHHHPHPNHLPGRALFIGLMHGVAGSAALILLVASRTHDLPAALTYILLFGLGSVLGMALLSVVIMLPMRAIQTQGLGRFWRGAQGGVALFTIVLGGEIIWRNLVGVMG
ncbi:MAG TPA: urease accessory protein [Gammaproteobacteria bacterium]|nr:urease accessory protein [Gammaproteobacteria bacterium]